MKVTKVISKHCQKFLTEEYRPRKYQVKYDQPHFKENKSEALTGAG